MTGIKHLPNWWQRCEITIIIWLNRFFPPPGVTPHTEEVAKKPRTELEEEEFAIGREVFAFLRKWTYFKHRVVLDLACGQGIKTTSYAAFDPEIKLVVGVDIDAKALQTAREFSRRRGVARATFVIADTRALPFKDQSVDIVISENAFEHVPRPQVAIQEAARVLREEGILSLRFFPLYYSRYGAHLWDYLRVPWVHVWASSEAVAAVYRKIIEAETGRLLRDFAGKYDEKDINTYLAFQIKQFTTLNKLTPRGFYHAVAATRGWRILHFALINTSKLERLLAYCPGLDRFTVWGIHCVLQRDSRSEISSSAFTRWRRRQALRRVRQEFAAWRKATVSRCWRSLWPQSRPSHDDLSEERSDTNGWDFTRPDGIQLHHAARDMGVLGGTQSRDLVGALFHKDLRGSVREDA